jgi:hypothetical protein
MRVDDAARNMCVSLDIGVAGAARAAGLLKRVGEVLSPPLCVVAGAYTRPLISST